MLSLSTDSTRMDFVDRIWFLPSHMQRRLLKLVDHAMAVHAMLGHFEATRRWPFHTRLPLPVCAPCSASVRDHCQVVRHACPDPAWNDRPAGK